MLTRVEFQFPQQPKLEKLTENEKKLLQYVEDIKKAVAETFRTLNRPDVLVIDQATINDSAIGGTTAAAGAFTTVTASGNISTSGGSVTIGTGGGYVAGSIYSDANWGMIFRSKQASPVQADYRWATSADAELMRLSATGLGIGMTPTRKLDVTGTFGATGISTFGSYLRAVDGSATTPSYSFTNSTNSGMYSSTAGIVDFAASGSAVFSYGNTGITMASGTYFKCAAAATGNSSIRLPHGTAPSIPVDGDMWTTTAGLYVRINGSTVGPLS